MVRRPSANGRLPWSVALTLALIGASLVPTGALAQDPPSSPVQVEVQAVGPSGLAGIALLSPTETGTAVQVLVVGAPAGTTAVVHPGTCEGTDATLVALLGDVGAGGQVQTTVPVPFESLADGGHVVALRPGLDMTTRLGCGPIPAAVAAPPIDAGSGDAPAPAMPPAGEGEPDDAGASQFAGSAFDFSLTWGEPWQLVPREAVEGSDALRLTTDTSSLDIAAFEGYDGDASRCASSWEARVFESLQAGRIGSMDRATGPDGTSLAGGDASHARAAFRYTVTAADGTSHEQIDLLDCRRLTDGAVLEVLLVSPANEFAEHLVLLDGLLASLVVEETAPTDPVAAPPEPAPPEPAPPEPEPEPEPVPLPEPEPQPLPEPSLEPECLAVVPWVTATEGRLSRITEALADLNDIAGRFDLAAYLAGIASFEGELQGMRARQAQETAPALASDINPRAVTALETYVDAARQIYDALTTADVNAYSRGQARYQEAADQIADVIRDIAALKGRCGIG